jgi:hypothetical protein
MVHILAYLFIMAEIAYKSMKILGELMIRAHAFIRRHEDPDRARQEAAADQSLDLNAASA